MPAFEANGAEPGMKPKGKKNSRSVNRELLRSVNLSCINPPVRTGTCNPPAEQMFP